MGRVTIDKHLLMTTGVRFMNDLVLVEKNGPIAILTLNRSARHNSLVPEFLQELNKRISDISADNSIRAVILQANSPSFSTGGDMKGFLDHMDNLQSYATEIVGLLNETILALLALPGPLIALVHGLVTGGSIGLVLAADIVLVTPEASFTPYYSVVGFSPDGGWTALLPKIIGPKRTFEIIARNLTITAEIAVELGLASSVVPADSIRERGLELARQLCQMKAGSVRRTKTLLVKSTDTVAADLERERKQFVQQIASEEARYGIEAFFRH